MSDSKTGWSLYILRTARGALYTGISTDVARRLVQHESGRGARSLRGAGPLRLEYQIWLGDKSLALRAEWKLKQLTRGQKDQLLASCPDVAGLMEMLGLPLPAAAR